MSKTFHGFLKYMDHDLYREYLMEKFEGEGRPAVPDYDAIAAEAAKTRSPELPDDPLGGLWRVSDLHPDHMAVQLVKRRGIPEERYQELYHADDFCGWANTLVPDRYPKGLYEPRLVIPFFTGSGRLFGFQGRSYDPKAKSKYLTASLDKSVPFLYGWNRASLAKPVVAVEGPIDAMFLDNGVASAGGSVTRELDRTGVDPHDFVVAYDNEPRSIVTIEKIEKAAEHFPVFIWPRTVYDKDFNDLFLRLVSEGKSTERARQLIMEMVRARTYEGLAAELEINAWRRAKR